ncbi:hypothetical protein K1T71_008028 [Dendrolimus kikuchii]|uniref:Uncharacterized protein n=1 Tax=Dendrolimus kikuchii TaxID=765133 RepID=A0ACC1CYP9_9NEOP|nr:hypothetical protein K1T71_008028 [Dendrolimus kikuchii]
MHVKWLLFIVIGSCDGCYWNSQCPYQLYSSKTVYDSIRGDIRDHPTPQNCEAVSIWTLNRHGNRNPGNSVTAAMKVIADLKDEIIASYEAGRGELCAQDIDEFKEWKWNETLEVSQSFLTGQGYEEIYDIAKRLREKYPQLLQGSTEDYYIRPTNEQRTITSAVAFVHGFSGGTNLSLVIDDARLRDDVIRPYENCDRYQQEVKTSQQLEDNLAAYYRTAEYIAVQNAVQRRLGITTQLTADDIYSFYEICRFYRSWTPDLRSPWCAAFSDEDLVVLEYRDDVRHYHRNGYGSDVNVQLGGLPLKDLYEVMEAAVQGSGRKITSYYTHDTMLEMVYCALDLYKDQQQLQGSIRNTNRLWRTSYIGAFSVNFIAVLNSCQEAGNQTYRVQIFNNEDITEICPLEGCTWDRFQEKFQPFTNANLDFCIMDYRVPGADNGASTISVAATLLVQSLLGLLLQS